MSLPTIGNNKWCCLIAGVIRNCLLIQTQFYQSLYRGNPLGSCFLFRKGPVTSLDFWVNSPIFWTLVFPDGYQHWWITVPRKQLITISLPTIPDMIHHFQVMFHLNNGPSSCSLWLPDRHGIWIKGISHLLHFTAWIIIYHQKGPINKTISIWSLHHDVHIANIPITNLGLWGL